MFSMNNEALEDGSMVCVASDELTPETELNPFDWRGFSRVDLWRHKVAALVQKAKCYLLGYGHRWEVVVRPWNLSRIQSVEDYRKYRAGRLRCVCCGEMYFVKDADLTEQEGVLYKFRTNILYKYYPNYSSKQNK
jgi:hypothetical protein